MRRLLICDLALAVTLLAALAVPAAAQGVSVADEWAAAGRVLLSGGGLRLTFSRDSGVVRVTDSSMGNAAEVMALRAFADDDAPATGVASCRAMPGVTDGAACRVSFTTRAGAAEATFSVNAQGAIRVQPEASLARLSVLAPIRYGLLPSRQVDDNVYDANDYPELAHFCLPSEHLFAGLVEGEGRVLVCAWPSKEQAPRLALEGPRGARRIAAFELAPAGKEFYLGAFAAPGIWKEVALAPATVEQDAAVDWKPPFDAAWKTQLTELGTPTTFRCLSRRQRPWRPTIGFHVYPFFMEEGKTLLHLHKSLAAEGRALIYALEGHPSTPYAFLTRNLTAAQQRGMAELEAVVRYYVLDPSPLPGGMMMNAHCNGRDQLKATTLTVGAQAREMDFLATHIDERVSECQFIVDYHVKRSLRCMDALDEQMERWLKEDAGNAAALAWVAKLKAELAAMRQEYRDRLLAPEPDGVMVNVHRAAERYKLVIREDGGRELCPEILACINELNAVISMEEDMGRRFGTLGRRLFQTMAYQCGADPLAAKHAEALRAILRDHLKYRQYESHGSSGYAESLLPRE